MQRNTIQLSREGREYCLRYSFEGESVAYIGKKIEGKKQILPLSFIDCLSLVDNLPKEFYSRKVKVNISRVDSPLIDQLEEDAFRAFVKLCEISSR